MKAKASKGHREKMERFHALVDLELVGSISDTERGELASLRAYIDQQTSPAAALMQKRIALQEQVFRESMELASLLQAGSASGARKGAAKSAKTGGRA